MPLLNVVFLHHPHSPNLIRYKDFRSRRINKIHLNCGFTNSFKDGVRESDFFPSYASHNSILFETSCILTIWEHLDDIAPEGPISFLHTDINPLHNVINTVDLLLGKKSFVCGLVIPEHHDKHESLIIDDVDFYRYSSDPWNIARFDGIVDILDLIRIVDKQSWEFANDTNPVMIYGHQFAVSRDIFNKVAMDVANIVMKLRLSQCGLWTPHVFERIWAIRFAMESNPILLSSFSHKLSSGSRESDTQYYGFRRFKYYKTKSRIFNHF